MVSHLQEVGQYVSSKVVIHKPAKFQSLKPGLYVKLYVIEFKFKVLKAIKTVPLSGVELIQTNLIYVKFLDPWTYLDVEINAVEFNP